MSDKPIPVQNPDLNLASVVRVVKQLKDAVEQLQEQVKALQKKTDG